MSISDRISNCKHFARAKCLHQKQMESLYLVPQCLHPKRLLEYQSICINCMQRDHTRRKEPRIPVSFNVRCKKEDGVEVGGETLNLCNGGIGIKTNCPLYSKEEISGELLVPNQIGPAMFTGVVVWCNHHYDNPIQGETLFTAGIRFLKFQETSQILMRDLRLLNRW